LIRPFRRLLYGRPAAFALATLLVVPSCAPFQSSGSVGGKAEAAAHEEVAAEAAIVPPAVDAAATPTAGAPAARAATAAKAPVMASAKIKHVVIVVQENHSFDNYFGTYPGADGIPTKDGAPAVCVNDPETGICFQPYHNPSLTQEGGPHSAAAAITDIDGGKMDGFIKQQDADRQNACRIPGVKLACSRKGAPADVMGYHDAREIPNYWNYAHNFVLQDHMYAPSASYTLPSHLFLVSGWSARCQNADPNSCTSAISGLEGVRRGPNGGEPESQPHAWTDLTYLLHKAGVSWAYYVAEGAEPECEGGGMVCPPKPQESDFDTYVSPLPRFQTVHDNRQVANVQPIESFFAAAAKGDLPAVSWVVPDEEHSEHPPASIRDGQAYVTRLVNAVMKSKNWDSTAIFITYDEWGGFYDHVVPPQVDGAGYGLRVPGLLISPYAKPGYVDHQTLSFDAYLKFVEDVFLNGQRLDPTTDGRPDPRPTVRENVPQLGNLMDEFDFTQSPRPPLVLDPEAAPGPPASDPAWRQPAGHVPAPVTPSRPGPPAKDTRPGREVSDIAPGPAVPVLDPPVGPTT